MTISLNTFENNPQPTNKYEKGKERSQGMPLVRSRKFFDIDDYFRSSVSSLTPPPEKKENKG